MKSIKEIRQALGPIKDDIMRIIYFDNGIRKVIEIDNSEDGNFVQEEIKELIDLRMK